MPVPKAHYNQLKTEQLTVGATGPYTFPTGLGKEDQVLQTDGEGQLTWWTPSTGALPSGGAEGQFLALDDSGDPGWQDKPVGTYSSVKYRICCTEGGTKVYGNEYGSEGQIGQDGEWTAVSDSHYCCPGGGGCKMKVWLE